MWYVCEQPTIASAVEAETRLYFGRLLSCQWLLLQGLGHSANQTKRILLPLMVIKMSLSISISIFGKRKEETSILNIKQQHSILYKRQNTKHTNLHSGERTSYRRWKMSFKVSKHHQQMVIVAYFSKKRYVILLILCQLSIWKFIFCNYLNDFDIKKYRTKEVGVKVIFLTWCILY